MIWAALRGSKLFWPAVGALVVVLALTGAYIAGGRANDAKRDAKALREQIETGNRINEAISDGAGVNWRDRLRISE